MALVVDDSKSDSEGSTWQTFEMDEKYLAIGPTYTTTIIGKDGNIQKKYVDRLTLTSL